MSHSHSHRSFDQTFEPFPAGTLLTENSVFNTGLTTSYDQCNDEMVRAQGDQVAIRTAAANHYRRCLCLAISFMQDQQPWKKELDRMGVEP